MYSVHVLFDFLDNIIILNTFYIILYNTNYFLGSKWSDDFIEFTMMCVYFFFFFLSLYIQIIVKQMLNFKGGFGSKTWSSLYLKEYFASILIFLFVF